MEIEKHNNGVCVDPERNLSAGRREDIIGHLHHLGMYLVWEDLSVVLPNFGNGHSRRLLDGLSGFAEPGRIMAIMGPSGSGKSTLLDSLAGRLSRNVVMTGNVLVNGKKRRLDYGVAFFARAGVPCPSRRNPSDHFLRCINSDFNRVTMNDSQRIRDIPKSSDPLMNLATAEIKEMLVEKYKSSEYATRTRARIREISSMEGPMIEKRSGSQATWWKQLSTLTKRSFLNMSRDMGYYWVRIVIYLLLSVCVGTIFFNLGTDLNSVLARGACAGFISGFMTFLSIGGFPSFLEEMKVFHKERLNGHYGIAVFILSNFLSSFPFLAVMSIATASITYYMVEFHSQFPRFVFMCLDLLSAIAAVESSMMIIASLVPNYLMGVIVGAGYLGIMMMTAGFFRLPPDLPKPVWRYPISYLNYGAWALQGEYKNTLVGREFDSREPNGPKLKGEYILTTIAGINLDHSKWWDLAAVVAILVSFRIIFFIILKLKERASPYFWTYYAKHTLKHLKKQPSFRKEAPFPSKRHQPLHPLAFQEGLNSPLH
ncbi:unnamed protein product [Prunus armeniaca]